MTKVFLDTSVLVAALVKNHVAHSRALPWLQMVKDGTAVGAISAHSLAELYATLTGSPTRPRISPQEAHRLIAANVIGMFEIVSLTDAEYAAVIDHVTQLNIIGGAIYDAVLLHAAEKSNADQIVTLNERDFRRVYPALAGKLVTP